MSTQLQLQQDLITAMKSGDKVAVSTIRMLKSALGYAKIQKGEELTEEDVIQLLGKEAKKRNETIVSAQQANRMDILEQETAELEIVSRYIPKQMDEAQVEAVMREVIAETGASGVKDTGKVMGAGMKKLRGKADGNLVSSVVQRLLAG